MTAIVFMDTETFDQVTLAEDMVGDQMIYLKENNHIQVTFNDDKALSVELPATVERPISCVKVKP